MQSRQCAVFIDVIVTAPIINILVVAFGITYHIIELVLISRKRRFTGSFGFK